MSEAEAHYEAESWFWEAEQRPTGLFWRATSLDLFAAMARRLKRGRGRHED